MRLVWKKSVFRVKLGKFLRFMVSERKVEANPKKIHGVLDLTKPKSIRDIQKLTRMITTLFIYIFRSAEKTLPFFKVLKWNKVMWKLAWEEAQTLSLAKLKMYMQKPPFLARPEEGEELLLYILVSPYILT